MEIAHSQPQQPSFDEWLEQASIPALEKELSEHQATFQEKLSEYGKLGDELRELDVEIERRTRVLDVIREIRPPEDTNEDAAAPDSSEQSGMTKRQIAERILREALRPMFPREVRDLAVERGWLADTPNAGNQLSVAMNRAAHQNHLVKDEEGRYSIRRTEDLTLPHSEEGDSS